MEASKRKVVVWISLLVALVAIIGVVLLFAITSTGSRTLGDYILNTPPSEEDRFEKNITTSIDINDELSVYAKNLLSGGPPPDGIPPIDDPKFVSSADADLFLKPDDQVFIVTEKHAAYVYYETKIYPQQILVWHEVVNDFIAGQGIAVTYSPLTGSAIAFRSNLGTSGMLLNSNSVYYDRDRESLWPQLLGTAISGDRRGQELPTIPLIWAKWEDAKALYPDAQVLSRDTGFDKSYGFDPYGSYTSDGSYYQTGEPFFPVMNKDDRLGDKEVVVTIRGNVLDKMLAVPKSEIESKKVIQLNFDGRPIGIFWDEELETAFVFDTACCGDYPTEYEWTYQDGIFVDQFGGQWNVTGGMLSHSSEYISLHPIPVTESMWFAWVAFYPETILWSENEISTEPSQVP